MMFSVGLTVGGCRSAEFPTQCRPPVVRSSVAVAMADEIDEEGVNQARWRCVALAVVLLS